MEQSIKLPIILPSGTQIAIEVNSGLNSLEEMEKPVAAESIKAPNFTPVLSSIKDISGALLDAIKEAKPQKASIEFSIEVGLEGGQLTSIITKGSAKSNLKITLEWTSQLQG